MEVMQDLLLVRLEHQEARSHTLAVFYGQTPQLLMISGAADDDPDQSLDSTETMEPRPPKPPIIAGLTLQTMFRNPWFFDAGQIADQRAYEQAYPQPYEHHNDSIEPNEDRYTRAVEFLVHDPTSALLPIPMPVQQGQNAPTDHEIPAMIMASPQTADCIEDSDEDYSDMLELGEDNDDSVRETAGTFWMQSQRCTPCLVLLGFQSCVPFPGGP